MSRAIVAILTFSFLLLTISCAKPEKSDIPASAQANQRSPASRNRGPVEGNGSREAALAARVMDDGFDRVPGQERKTGDGEAELKSKEEGQAGAIQEAGATEASDATEGESESTTNEGAAEAAGKKVMIADGGLQVIVPESWKEVTPASTMIEVEYSVPGEDEETVGRVTGMLAGGSVEANIDRWYGQFVQPDGSATKDLAKMEELEVGKLKIHKVDISGTFLEGMGPIAPKTERENYRMLAAIIEMESDASYFLKFSGPAELVEKHAAGFVEMLKGLKSPD